MYSWGMLFVTLIYLMLYNVVRKGGISDWLLFAAASVAAAYTHYFACVAVSGFYLVLLVWVAWKDKKYIKEWLMTVLVTIMGYLPWLVILVKQLKNVKENYWISEIEADTVHHEFFAFILDNGYLFYIVAIVVAMGIIRMTETRLCQWEDSYWLTGISIPFWTMAIGVAALIIVRPVFVSRYLLPSMGCFWLGLIGSAEQGSDAHIIKNYPRSS